MGDVRASAPHSIWTAFYHKAWRSFKALVEILKMIRNPAPLNNGVGRSRGKLFVGDDIWWCIFSFFPFISLLVSFIVWVEGSGIDPGVLPIVIVFGVWPLGHSFALFSVAYWHREMSPFRLIGAKGKFMIEVIPLILSAASRRLLDLNYWFLLLLLSCSTYFYTFAHFLHAAYDIGGKDVLLGSSMLVLVHWLNEDLFAGALALSFCLGVSFYRYVTYHAPELPIHPKKELEELLPC